MKAGLILLVLMLLSVRSAAATVARATAASSSALSPADAFAPVKANIEKLLEHRRQPPPFSPETENPFVRPGAPGADAVITPTVTAPTAPTAIVPTADLIHRLAAHLHVGGMVDIGGHLQVVINSIPCSEGRLIPVRDGETVYRVRIKQLTNKTMTIEVGDSELTLPLH